MTYTSSTQQAPNRSLPAPASSGRLRSARRPSKPETLASPCPFNVRCPPAPKVVSPVRLRCPVDSVELLSRPADANAFDVTVEREDFAHDGVLVELRRVTLNGCELRGSVDSHVVDAGTVTD